MKLSNIFQDYLSHNKAFFEHLRDKKSINERKDIDFSTLVTKVHQEYAPIFVLSTGRNGTLLLTNLLSKTNNTIVFHEPEPELSMASKLAYEKHDSDSTFVCGMFEGARYEYLRSAFLLDKKFIETNNRITFFAYEIAKLYPRAKFIHLVRNPYAFIKSGIGRNWYSGETLYDEARIVSNDVKLWSSLNQYEKIAWLWNETNEFIENFKIKNPTRIITIKAENLFSSVETSNEIFDFCEVNRLNKDKIKKLISVKINSGKSLTYNKELLEKAVHSYAFLRVKYNY